MVAILYTIGVVSHERYNIAHPVPLGYGADYTMGKGEICIGNKQVAKIGPITRIIFEQLIKAPGTTVDTLSLAQASYQLEADATVTLRVDRNRVQSAIKRIRATLRTASPNLASKLQTDHIHGYRWGSPTERTKISDVKEYLNQYRFDIDKWKKGEIDNDQLFCQFVKFTTVLGLSDPMIREKYGIDTVEIPQGSLPIPLIEDLANPIKITRPLNRTFHQRMFINSHLFIPYVFPHVLIALRDTNMLSDSGLKSLASIALKQSMVKIEPQMKQQIMANIPQGIFEDKKESEDFLSLIVYVFRESNGRTALPMQALNSRQLDMLAITKDDTIHKTVLQELRNWFNPDEFFKHRYIKYFTQFSPILPPDTAQQRIAALERHKAIIYESLLKS